MSDDFQQELTFLGHDSSPSFVREPEGNGCAERFIRTLKENLLWVRTFATVAELVEALREFKRTYNEQWLIERHGYRTPAQVRRHDGHAARGRLIAIGCLKIQGRYTGDDAPVVPEPDERLAGEQKHHLVERGPERMHNRIDRHQDDGQQCREEPEPRIPLERQHLSTGDDGGGRRARGRPPQGSGCA